MSQEMQEPIRRSSVWRRAVNRVSGRTERRLIIDELRSLLINSYAVISEFPHPYPCERQHLRSMFRALDFDPTGIYLASGLGPACLTIHQFEEGRDNMLHHWSFQSEIYVVKWANPNEVAYIRARSERIGIYDIGHTGSRPKEILTKDGRVGSYMRDVAFFRDDSRCLAPDNNGEIHFWDRREGNHSRTKMKTTAINNIHLSAANENILFGAGDDGRLLIWDLRYRRPSNELTLPFEKLNVHAEFEELDFEGPKHLEEVVSMSINPTCQNQLGFHLSSTGCSGVYNTHLSKVTHMYCPGLENTEDHTIVKASWLPNDLSIYAVRGRGGLCLLDFSNDLKNVCHLDSGVPLEERRNKNGFVRMDATVMGCAVNPISGAIVVGVEEDSDLRVLAPRRSAYQGGD